VPLPWRGGGELGQYPLLALSNLLWWAAYRSLDQAYMQEEGLRDESDAVLRTTQADCRWYERYAAKAPPQPAPNR
jgi:hypothetical protein